MKVSVIVPVYNRERYIKDCIDSVLAQSLKEIEVICVDDGSTDNTPEILDAYAKSDNRIVVVHKNNTGYGHSMNVGISKATGEYVGIVESDDFVSDDMYEKLYEFASSHDADIVKADFYVFYGDGEDRIENIYNILSEKNKGMYEAELNYKKDMRVWDAYMTSWSGIYKRSFLNRYRIEHNETPGASFQDNGFWLQTILYARKVYFINQAFYHLRRDNEDSSVYSKEKVFAICNEFDFMHEKLIEYGEELDKLLPWFLKFRYSACLSDAQRVAYESRKDLILRVCEDFQNHVNRGDVSKSNISIAMWNHICEMRESPEDFYERYFRISDYAIEKLSGSKQIVVYGAGGYSSIIIGDIQTSKWADKLVGVVVSDVTKNPRVKSRIRVKSLAECDYEKDTLFVIAVKNEQDSIEQELKQKCYNNVIRCQEFHCML